VVNLEIKKSDLKTEPSTKPSAAWGSALDVSKTAPAKTEEKGKIDFFSSSALQEKAGNSNLMENITSQKLKVEQPKIGDLLGKQSKILEKTIEQETLLNYKKRLRVVQFMAFMIFLIALGVNTFLYAQLSPGISLGGYFNYNFDSNLRNDVFNLNQSLRSVQTGLNTYRFLSGQLYLNQFGYETTRFMDAVGSNPQEVTAISDREKIIADAKDSMPKLLKGAKENLTQSLVVPTFPTRGEEKGDDNSILADFQRSLRSSILTVKKSVLEAKAEGGVAPNDAEAVFYDNSAKMVGNTKLMTNLQSTNLENFKNQVELFASTDFDPTQRESFKKSINNLLDSTKVNLATITNLRNSRIAWSDVLDRIEAITNKVNTDHNSGSGIDNDSQIVYSGFDFNAENGKITVSGLNTTKHGTNREVVTYLMEAFEASPEFKNATNRSFPLSRIVDASGNESYSMNFKIDMEIESGSFSKSNAPIISLLQEKMTARALVKRIKK
jgi:hypothetical protein